MQSIPRTHFVDRDNSCRLQKTETILSNFPLETWHLVQDPCAFECTKPSHSQSLANFVANFLLDVGMPCLHPHPKTSLGLYPLPPFVWSHRPSFGYAFEALPLLAFAACSFACISSRERRGAWSKRPRPLYNHHYNHLFGKWARDDLPAHLPVCWVVLAPPSPSIGP